MRRDCICVRRCDTNLRPNAGYHLTFWHRSHVGLYSKHRKLELEKNTISKANRLPVGVWRESVWREPLFMKHLIEWYLGVPRAEPGQGTAWRFVTERPWPTWMPSWFVLIVVVALITAVVMVYRRDASRLSRPRQLLLMTLRLSVLGLLAAFLFQLAIVIERTGLPFIAVMIDDSASMGLDDEYETADATAVTRLGNSATDGPPSRLSIAKSILTQQDAGFLRELLSNQKVRLYRFSDTAVPLGQSVSDDGLQSLIGQIDGLKANGRITRPGPAMNKVLDDFRGSPPLAIIMLTDGITTSDQADRLSAAVSENSSRQVPLFLTGLGSEEPNKDLQLFDVQVDEIAIVDDPVIVSARVKSFGFSGKPATLQLLDKASRNVLATKVINLLSDGEVLPTELTWTPRVEGEFDIIVELTPLTGERNPDNNREVRHVSVRQGRMKVLYVENSPRFEFRYIKTFFERQGNDSNSIELHTILLDGDTGYANQDQSARVLAGRFPINRDELFAYDVIVFGDVDPGFLSARSLENVRDFVREKGGGLVMIAGANHNPQSYRGTALESLFPIDIGRVPAIRHDAESEFVPQLTIQGRKSTPVFRFEDSEADSLKAWSTFPPLRWIVEAPALSPGAVVLVEHPTKTGDSGRLPVIVQHQYGAGKVVFHATDELWLWRLRAGDKYYGRYWLQLIRYLSRSNLLGQNRSVELSSDRLIYQPDEPIGLRVRFLDERLVPKAENPVSVTLERRDGFQQRVVLPGLPNTSNVFEARIESLANGSYHAWVDSPSFDQTAPAIDFRVEVPSRELRERGLAKEELVRAARGSRGGFYTPATAFQIPDDLPTGRQVTIERHDPMPLWNRWELLLLFVGLLSVEWVLRKRYRLV